MLSGESGANGVCNINVVEACEFNVGTQKLTEIMPTGCDTDNCRLDSALTSSQQSPLKSGGYPIQTSTDNVFSLGLVE